MFNIKKSIKAYMINVFPSYNVQLVHNEYELISILFVGLCTMVIILKDAYSYHV